MRDLKSKLTRNEWVLLASTLSIALFWVFTQHLTFTGDSSTYLQYANWLTGHDSISPIWYLRSPGLPLALILSGVTGLSSFTGFMLLQAIVSVGIVWLFYAIIKTTQPKYALVAAWISVISAVPFIFATMLMTEHLNLFTHLLLLYGLVVFYETKNTKFIWLVAIANIFLFLLKPSNYYLAAISLAFIMLVSEKQFKRSVLTFVAVYGTVIFLYMSGFGLLKLAHPGLEGLCQVSPAIRALLYGAYMDKSIDSGFGSANKIIKENINDYITEMPAIDLINKQPAELFGEFVDNRAELTWRITQQPNGYYFNFMADILVAKHGKKQAELMLIKATWEIFKSKPKLFWSWFRSIYSASSTNYAGQMLFYQLMLKSPYMVQHEGDAKHSNISIENGAATVELLHHLEHYILTQEHKWTLLTPEYLFGNFRGRPQDLLTNILQNPTHVYHWFIWQALDREVGPSKASELFMQSAIEGYKHHPVAALSFIDDLAAFFFGPDLTHRSGSRVVFLPNPGVGEKTIPPGASLRMIEQIKAPVLSVDPQLWSSIYKVYGWTWLLLKPLILILALVGIFRSYGSKMFPIYLLTWVLIVYNALIICVFADPFFRYSALTWFLTLMLGFQSCMQMLESRMKAINFQKTATVTQ